MWPLCGYLNLEAKTMGGKKADSENPRKAPGLQENLKSLKKKGAEPSW